VRVAGEQWLVRQIGSYMPNPYEQIVETIKGYVLTDGKALHIRAKANYTDFKETERKTGEEWLITKDDAECIIPEVHEEIIR